MNAQARLEQHWFIIYFRNFVSFTMYKNWSLCVEPSRQHNMNMNNVSLKDSILQQFFECVGKLSGRLCLMQHHGWVLHCHRTATLLSTLDDVNVPPSGTFHCITLPSGKILPRIPISIVFIYYIISYLFPSFKKKQEYNYTIQIQKNDGGGITEG